MCRITNRLKSAAAALYNDGCTPSFRTATQRSPTHNPHSATPRAPPFARFVAPTHVPRRRRRHPTGSSQQKHRNEARRFLADGMSFLDKLRVDAPVVAPTEVVKVGGATVTKAGRRAC
jgi:hypothetical protein